MLCGCWCDARVCAASVSMRMCSYLTTCMSSGVRGHALRGASDPQQVMYCRSRGECQVHTQQALLGCLCRITSTASLLQPCQPVVTQRPALSHLVVWTVSQQLSELNVASTCIHHKAARNSREACGHLSSSRSF